MAKSKPKTTVPMKLLFSNRIRDCLPAWSQLHTYRTFQQRSKTPDSFDSHGPSRLSSTLTEYSLYQILIRDTTR